MSRRVLAWPEATLYFLSNKASAIFSFHPHGIVVHDGMFDLLRHDCNLLALMDHYWHNLGQLISCLSGSVPIRVILVDQLHCPPHLAPALLHVERLDACHMCLIWCLEGPLCFPYIFVEDFLGQVLSRKGWWVLVCICPHPIDLPFHLTLSVVRRCIAAILAPWNKYLHSNLFYSLWMSSSVIHLDKCQMPAKSVSKCYSSKFKGMQ